MECHCTSSSSSLLGLGALFGLGFFLRLDVGVSQYFGAPRGGNLIGQVYGYGDLTESLTTCVKERVEDQPREQDNECLIHDLVTRGEGNPHGEEHAGARHTEIASQLPTLHVTALRDEERQLGDRGEEVRNGDRDDAEVDEVGENRQTRTHRVAPEHQQ